MEYNEKNVSFLSKESSQLSGQGLLAPSLHFGHGYPVVLLFNVILGREKRERWRNKLTLLLNWVVYLSYFLYSLEHKKNFAKNIYFYLLKYKNL